MRLVASDWNGMLVYSLELFDLFILLFLEMQKTLVYCFQMFEYKCAEQECEMNVTFQETI